MKIRNGFISNSSTSSFVVAKAYMTEEQIKEFGKFITKQEEYEEYYIKETEYYFSGSGDEHLGRDYDRKLLELIDKKYMVRENW
jgi:hypothetical protein